MGRDLDRAALQPYPDCAEPLTLQPHGVDDAVHQNLHLVGCGVGGQVQVWSIDLSAQQLVSYDPSHQVEAVTRPVESVGERCNHPPLLVERSVHVPTP